MPFPNLFDDSHTPVALAEILRSLFGPVTEDFTGSSSSPRPLGPGAVLDGFDVQVPVLWKGTYQDRQFHALVNALKDAVEGSLVYFGWTGEMLGRRGVEWGGM